MNSSFPPDVPKEFKDAVDLYKPAPNYVSPEVKKIVAQVPPEKAYKNAANTLYWIAGLSLVNSLVFNLGGGFKFVMGLGITQLVDVLAYLIVQEQPDAKSIFLVITLVIDTVLCGVIALFGYLTSKNKDWPLIAGVVLYIFDTFLIFSFKDWVGFGFHLFFLWQIWASYKLIRLWKKIQFQNVLP